MELSNNVQRFADDLNLLVTYPAHVFQPIVDIAHAVYNSFFDYGVEVEMRPVSGYRDLSQIAQQGTYSHILSINTHDYLRKGEEFYMDKPKITKLMSYNLEQSPIEGQNSYWASMRLNEVGYYGPFFDYIVSESPCKDRDILNMGMRVLNLNLPYHPILDLGVKPTLEDKEYDVMFIGCGSERRESLIKSISDEGFSIAPVPLPQALGKEYKSDIVKKTKICLNVHFSDMEYFEKPRIFYDLFMNKATVLTEKILYPEIFNHMEHFYMAKYMNVLPLLVLMLNKYDEKMVEMGYKAYETFKTEHHYEKVIPSFLTQLYEKDHQFRRSK